MGGRQISSSGAATTVVAINSGGSAAGTFAADEDFTAHGTWTYATTNAINTSGVTNPAPQAVYADQRTGPTITYTIPGLTPSAAYTIRLSFAELWFSAAGQRVFNVSINGTQVLTKYDVYAAAGARYKAVAPSFATTASSAGTIVITLKAVTNDAVINGIEVDSAGASTPKVNVLTYHNDMYRTGWNANEKTLTASNVNTSSFGLQHTIAVDGRVDAQPLVVANEPIDGQGTHDVVYVATENDTIYAIDATTGAILAVRNLGQSIPYTAKDFDENIYPVYGILSTPVIDLAQNAIYVVTETNEGAGAPDVYRLHKLALNNFKDLVPSAVVVPSATLADGSTYVFPAKHERQHPGLLEANGYIYIAFSSTGDTQPAVSRGVVAAYTAQGLVLVAGRLTDRLVQNRPHPFYLSSVWQSGYGLAADAQGYVYFSTGNSDPSSPGYSPTTYNFPDSVLKMSANLNSIVSSFTQYDYFAQDQGDGDLGAGGTLLIPDQPGGVYPRLLVAGGKDGRAYVLNRDALGGFHQNGPNNDIAELNSGPCWCGPAYFVGADGLARIVTGGANGVTTWKFQDGAKLAIAHDTSAPGSLTNGQPDFGGSIPAVSSNGTTAGSGIVWIVQRPNEKVTFTMTLRAFNAANLATQLFAAPAGNWSDFNSNANAVPTVANGHVYVGSYKQLRIFGLLK